MRLGPLVGLILVLQTGCAVAHKASSYKSCWLTQEEVETYPVLRKKPEPGLFRFRGIYIGAFEMSNLVAYWPEDVYAIPPDYPVAYCVLWLGECDYSFRNKMAAPAQKDERFAEFAEIEGVAAWAPQHSDPDTSYGCIRVVGLSSIRTPIPGEALVSLH